MRKIKGFKGFTVNTDDLELSVNKISIFDLLPILCSKKYTPIIKENGGYFYGVYKRYVKKEGTKGTLFFNNAFLKFDDCLDYLRDSGINLNKYESNGYDCKKVEVVVDITKNMNLVVKYCYIPESGLLYHFIDYISMSPNLYDIANMSEKLFGSKIKEKSILMMIEKNLPYKVPFIKYVHTKRNIDKTDPRIINIKKYKKKSFRDIADEIEIRQLMGGDNLVQEWLNNYLIVDQKVKK
jgi:hypothetical protein